MPIDDAFDPQRLRLPQEVVQPALVEAKKSVDRKARHVRRKGAFVQVPLPWAYRALTTLSTAHEAAAFLRLLYRLWEDRKPPAPFAENVQITAADMRACGLGVGVRNKMLRRLEQAGLATVMRGGREGPTVTLFFDREPNTPEWDALESAIEKIALGAPRRIWRPRDLLGAIQPPDNYVGAWPKTAQQLTAALRRHRPGSVRRRKGRTCIFWEKEGGPS